jgi:hypothetical protein
MGYFSIVNYKSINQVYNFQKIFLDRGSKKYACKLEAPQASCQSLMAMLVGKMSGYA